MCPAGHFLIGALIFGHLVIGIPDTSNSQDNMSELKFTLKKLDISRSRSSGSPETQFSLDLNDTFILLFRSKVSKFSVSFICTEMGKFTSDLELQVEKCNCSCFFSFPPTLHVSCTFSFPNASMFRRDNLIFKTLNSLAVRVIQILWISNGQPRAKCTSGCNISGNASSRLISLECKCKNSKPFEVSSGKYLLPAPRKYRTDLLNDYVQESNIDEAKKVTRERRSVVLMKNYRYLQEPGQYVGAGGTLKGGTHTFGPNWPNGLECLNIEMLSDHQSVYTKQVYDNVISISAVDMYIDLPNWSQLEPWLVYVSVDSRLCTRVSSRSLKASQDHMIFSCQGGQTLQGSVLTMEFFTLAASDRENITLRMCRLKPLTCLPGLFGPGCIIYCNCLECEIPSNLCAEGCNQFSKGPNCGTKNIVGGAGFITTKSQISSTKPNPSPSVRFGSSRWYAFKMATKQSVRTVSLRMSVGSSFGNYDIYTESRIDVDNLYGDEISFWTGDPCFKLRYQRESGRLSFSAFCNKVTDTILVVFYSIRDGFSFPEQDIGIWTCINGTFGLNCEHMCNCRSTTEVCDKWSGHCNTGCAVGYIGSDCQTPCSVLDQGKTANLTNCSQPATHCKGVSEFRPSQGSSSCLSGCSSGWTGRYCDIPCADGWHGENCLETCGDCKNGTTCDRVTGICLFGCENANWTRRTCDQPESEQIIPITRAESTSGEVAMKRLTIIIIIMVTMGIIVGFYLCGMSVHLYMSATDPQGTKKHRRATTNKRIYEKMVNSEILKEHRDFHKDYVIRKTIGGNEDDEHEESSEEEEEPGADNTAYRTALRDINKDLVMESRKKKIEALKEAARRSAVETSASVPNKELQRNDFDLKVAKWITDQDFDELINRRKRRLETGEDPLTMDESTYKISVVNLSVSDLNKLYDDAAALQLP